MSNLGEKENPYIQKFKNADEVRQFIRRGGLFKKMNRIEEVFSDKLKIMNQKIHRIISGYFKDDELSYRVYVNSILTDCRAMFLENSRCKFNSTLQSTYRARGLEILANEIDEIFNEAHNPTGKQLREIIKSWIDKRVVHYDYLESEKEKEIREDIENILDQNSINNLFEKLIIISISYENLCDELGKNSEEQLEKTLSWLTGDPLNSSDGIQANGE